jgi:hypothetical protein
MATSSSYYLNAPSLGSATAVFLDEALSECAPNGFYSNGVIVREQVGCVLLPQQSCPSCVTYNCVEGTCVEIDDSTGTYATLEACESACSEGSATLSWSFTESGGSVGNMDLYVNDSLIESRSNTSSGTFPVYVGDDIRVEVDSSGCTGTNGKANAYTMGIIADANCADTSTTLITGVYTVQVEDIGDTLTLNTFALCDTACV